MAAQIGIWSISSGGPHRVERARVDLESDLEGWCATDPLLLSDGLRIVGRQVRCAGGYIDLLGIDAQERWVIIELKRARLYRDALVQAIDYASSISEMDSTSLREAIEKANGEIPNPENALEKVDLQLKADESGREIAIVVAGTGTDPGLDRVVDYLGGFEIPIKVITFDVFEHSDGSRLLVREVLDEEEQVKKQSEKRKVRTVEQIAGLADKANVGEPFRLIIEAAQQAGLHCRPYVRSVMITPESNKGRYLMVLTPQEGNGIRFSYGPGSFAEFFDLEASDVEEIIGDEGSDKDTYLTSDNWEPIVSRIIEFLESLPEEVEIQNGDDGRRADFDTVSKFAAQVKAGEWTTYRDLSIAAIGRSSASMAIGGHARTNLDFPNPHRVMGHKGRISPQWKSHTGGGPEECQKRLEGEGLTFDAKGTANPEARVSAEELTRRANNTAA
jgi:alkylated DNA nucleotide flippase Atl1